MALEPLPLPAAVEALLSEAPMPTLDWDTLATKIDARVKETEAKSTAPLWLMAPLPDAADEPGANPVEAAPPAESAPAPLESETAPTTAAASEPAVAQAESSTAVASQPSPGQPSLAALARSVAHKSARPEANAIAKESLSVAAAARVTSERVAERARSGAAATPAAVTPRGSAPPAPPSARAAAVAPAQPAEATRPFAQRSELGPWIAIGGIGMAAAVALLVFWRPREPAPIVVVQQPAPQLSAVGAVAQAGPERTADSPLPPLEPAKAEAAAPVLAASALPALPHAVTGSGTLAPARAGSEATPSAQLAAAGTAAAASHPAPEQIQLDEAPAKPSVASGAAAPAAASGLRPAAGSPAGGLPMRPATGAVQAAIGSVMSAARACVAGGVASPAQITFASDGSVTNVSVSGPAAGTAAASCIEAALRRARVAPFASPTFSLGVWVRP